jgi:hypothetical protein
MLIENELKGRKELKIMRMKKILVYLIIIASVFTTGCDASKILDTISKVAQGIQNAMPAIKEVVNTFQNAFSSNNDNNNAVNDNTNNDTPPEVSDDNDAATVVLDPTDTEEVGAAPAADDSPANSADSTVDDDNAIGDGLGDETEDALKEPAKEETAVKDDETVKEPESTSSTVNISSRGKSQMSNVVDYALRNHKGGSNGNCFNAVWGYLTSSGYGKLDQWGDLPNMQSTYAKDFAIYLNARPGNLDEAGLQRLDTAYDPPITNPHDSRIPKGAVIVVAPGSTGTAHATAGDIVIKGDGRFINDGPNMDYGTKSTWTGKVLGVYIPK